MKRILVTGATGNVGMEVIRYLFKNETACRIAGGVRNIPEARKKLAAYERLNFVQFDFEDPSTFITALENVDLIFLLRPPHISSVDRYFKPLVEAIKTSGIRQVVFLSVQGAEKSTLIPHNQIEKLISEARIPYIFLRPSYFMQNLTTTLLSDIRNKQQLILPAGKAVFNWIDIANIGEVAAMVMERFAEFSSAAIELTGYENLNFAEVTGLINQQLNSQFRYIPVSPFRFFRIKKQEGKPNGLILVMVLLHYLPRFQKEPTISGFYEQLTGKKPTTISEFAKRERIKFENPKI